MDVASIKELKRAIENLSPKELSELCLKLAKSKKETKELLSYLVFNADDETGFITAIKQDIDEGFAQLNTSGYYYMKSGIRKVLRNIKKHIRFSKQKQTEVELLLYFCQKMQQQKPTIKNNTVLLNMYNTQHKILLKALSTLHEDIQFDYQEAIANLM